ncbi:hypothetical protein TNCV_669521 [Trichonephila clavipes]|nr:hypothetical protein TNCV_669521 [Trichonephila clavipes]
MFPSSSFVNPTPLAHTDTPRDNHPRGDYHNGSQQDLIYMTPRLETRDGLMFYQKCTFPGPRTSPSFWRVLTIKSNYLRYPVIFRVITGKVISWRGPRLVSDIRFSVSAEYRHGLRTAESSIVESIPCHPK